MSESEILTLYTTHQRMLVNYAYSIVNDSARAEDIAQDAYMRFCSAMADEWRDNPVGYLYRIVRNLALDCRRRTLFERGLFSGTDDEIAVVPCEAPNPEGQAIQQNEMDCLLAALNELPERTRIAIEMHRFGGYKLREIALHLNVSVSMAQYLIKEGIKHCQHRLFPVP